LEESRLASDSSFLVLSPWRYYSQPKLSCRRQSGVTILSRPARATYLRGSGLVFLAVPKLTLIQWEQCCSLLIGCDIKWKRILGCHLSRNARVAHGGTEPCMGRAESFRRGCVRGGWKPRIRRVEIRRVEIRRVEIRRVEIRRVEIRRVEIRRVEIRRAGEEVSDPASGLTRTSEG